MALIDGLADTSFLGLVIVLLIGDKHSHECVRQRVFNDLSNVCQIWVLANLSDDLFASDLNRFTLLKLQIVLVMLGSVDYATACFFVRLIRYLHLAKLVAV